MMGSTLGLLEMFGVRGLGYGEGFRGWRLARLWAAPMAGNGDDGLVSVLDVKPGEGFIQGFGGVGFWLTLLAAYATIPAQKTRLFSRPALGLAVERPLQV